MSTNTLISTKRICFVLLFCSIYNFSKATDFYFSATGNNLNNGTSVTTPFKTIKRLNALDLQPGDNVYFRSGDVFEGSLTIRNSGDAQNPIVISAYGNDKKPILMGAIELKAWDQYKDSIYYTAIDQDVKGLYSGNELLPLARYPNNGYLSMGDFYESPLGFTDRKLTQTEHYWEGSTLRYRCNWHAGQTQVISYENNRIVIPENSIQYVDKGSIYYFDNKFTELDTCKEWFYNQIEKRLYYFSSNKISKEVIKAVVFDQGISVNKSVKNVVIRGLQIEKYENYGILLRGNNENISISDCVIGNINGTGIHINDSSTNCVTKNNEIHDTNGRGIYASEPDNLAIVGNKISHIGGWYGYGITGTNGMVGIALINREVKKGGNAKIARNNLISHNYLDSIGYVGIRCDGTNNLIENNVVKNSMLLLNDGGGIYCWATGPNYTFSNIPQQYSIQLYR